MSTLIFWNKQNGTNQNSEQKNGKRNWLHAPEVLINGHVAYPVKFLGSTPVDQPKGIEVVKEAIRRLQFSQQIKKAESGSNIKTKKVEITVSINGVAVQKQENKGGQQILHQFPLHKISYCADEKGAKKFFSFIAKTGTSNLNGTTINSDTMNSSTEGHECFVFISNKLASDITLTIGQAFDLAYRRYLNENKTQCENSNGSDKQQKSNNYLENAIETYKKRLNELANMIPKAELDKLLLKFGINEICELPPSLENGEIENNTNMNGNSKTTEIGMIDLTSNIENPLLIETSNKLNVPIVPPRNFQNPLNQTLDALKPSVGTKLEGLLLNSDSDSDFDPRACESETSSNGNNNNNNINHINNNINNMNNNNNNHTLNDHNINDLFGFEPPKQMGQQYMQQNNLNGMINGNNGVSTHPSSPPPLLAPPPKAATPRRNPSTQINNNHSNSNSKNNINNKTNCDLFGSTPFSPFDAPESSSMCSASNDTELLFSSIEQQSNVFQDSNSSNIFATPSSTVTTTTTTSNSIISNKNYDNDSNNDSYNNNNINNNINPVLNEITALSSNFDKLDNILIKNNYNKLNDETKGTTTPINTVKQNSNNNLNLLNSSNLASLSSASKKLNPFNKINNARSKSPAAYNDSNTSIINKDNQNLTPLTSSSSSSSNSTSANNTSKSLLTKTNPFARNDNFLNRNLKYDAFKNAVEFESFSIIKSDYNTIGFGGNDGGGNITMGGNNSELTSNSTLTNFNDDINKKMFHNNNNNYNHNNNNFNEFSNKLIDPDHKNDFYTSTNNSNGLNFGIDDFTLESLDPLRK